LDGFPSIFAGAFADGNVGPFAFGFPNAGTPREADGAPQTYAGGCRHIRAGL
jgi:hypothetical protein